MDPTPPFLVRRVLLGVVVGLAVLAVGFFGWTRYRVGQYHHRETTVLAGYRAEYRSCLALGSPASYCVSSVDTACAADPFWRGEPPFTLGWGAGGADDGQTRCQSDVTASPRPG